MSKKINNCINIPSSQTFMSYLLLNLSLNINLLKHLEKSEETLILSESKILSGTNKHKKLKYSVN